MKRRDNVTLWMVRAGRHGEQEQDALEQSVVTIGWDELRDLSKISDREELRKLYIETYETSKKGKIANEVGQIWTFVNKIEKGDLVALPLKMQASIAIGEVKGSYEYEKLTENIRHFRRVKWLKTIPRSEFDQDLLYSLGAFMTVCKISRNNAENRVKRMLGIKGPKREDYDEEIEEEKIDIEEYGRDEIVKFIDRKFKGHDLARLVEAVLGAQGYITSRSKPGPDGGVDIRAAGGPLGFENPRICVQVKSTSAPVGVEVLRELQGVVTDSGADQGLVVSWGGFKSSALKQSRERFFSIRTWDSVDLLKNIFRHYNHFDDELKAELPLKRIWTLVPEE